MFVLGMQRLALPSKHERTALLALTKKIRILALDPGTHCGWAHSSSGSGTWDLSVKQDESGGMRLYRLQRCLIDQFTQGTDLVVFEASRNLKYGNAVRVAGQIQGVIELVCTNFSVEYRGYSPKEVKKHATDNGNADKTKMLAAAKKKWPKVKFVDDNHADACWLLDLAVSQYGECVELTDDE
jgi:Holliday junction resolvasome RuvABC endonuclease subunit